MLACTARYANIFWANIFRGLEFRSIGISLRLSLTFSSGGFFGPFFWNFSGTQKARGTDRTAADGCGWHHDRRQRHPALADRRQRARNQNLRRARRPGPDPGPDRGLAHRLHHGTRECRPAAPRSRNEDGVYLHETATEDASLRRDSAEGRGL